VSLVRQRVPDGTPTHSLNGDFLMIPNEPTLVAPMAPSNVDAVSIFACHEKRSIKAAALRSFNKDRIFDSLTAAGVTHVTVIFDGDADGTQIESIGAWLGEHAVEFPKIEVAFAALAKGGVGARMHWLSLPEAVEQLALDLLADVHDGLELSARSYGEFCFDAAERCIHLEFHECGASPKRADVNR